MRARPLLIGLGLGISFVGCGSGDSDAAPRPADSTTASRTRVWCLKAPALKKLAPRTRPSSCATQFAGGGVTDGAITLFDGAKWKSWGAAQARGTARLALSDDPAAYSVKVTVVLSRLRACRDGSRAYTLQTTREPKKKPVGQRIAGCN